MHVRRLIWDASNVPHIARHVVTPEEVEDVCHHPHAVRQGYVDRLMLIGRTSAGRTLVVILDPHTGEDDVYCPVTARHADRKERKIYEEFSSAHDPEEETDS